MAERIQFFYIQAQFKILLTKLSCFGRRYLKIHGEKGREIISSKTGS